MKLSIVAPLDSKAKKMLEQFRYEYDRKLLKLFEPVVEIIPPIECYTNIKKLQKTLTDIFRSISRFKIKINGIGSALPDYVSLHFMVEHEKKLSSLRDQLTNLHDFSELKDTEFTPHIPFFRFGDIDDAEEIYESLKDTSYKHQFFVTQLYLISNHNNNWETVEEYQL